MFCVPWKKFSSITNALTAVNSLELTNFSSSIFEYDFMVKTMKHDITKAIQFSNTFRYIDDLFSINNVDFGNFISAIYPPELQLTDTSTSSTEVCYLDTHIKTGDRTTPFRISIYDKRDDFTFRIVNFPHMDSNIPANPAYGVYISQLVRYARICTSKVDFMNRLRGLSKSAQWSRYSKKPFLRHRVAGWDVRHLR